ncbi:hypothetical protein IWW34DRAFT_640706 [Fusarium oxysporum f. sp. albedinis]|nr:hypothetical protein IWW34DRAFT_640706 [Fusarium oxysporum f. sp. albedinis]KAJ0128976.1 Uncharacterized protein HZ326_27930 [Fusarium oxysporum f. sp. albedinis]
MDTLPPKVYWMLLGNLPLKDLCNIMRCSRSLCKMAQPMLYRVLHLNFNDGNLRSQTLLLLRTLVCNPGLSRFVTSISLENNGSRSWTKGHSQLLSLVLSGVSLRPERITGFSTTSSWLPLDKYFLNLNSVAYTGHITFAELDWFRWHLSNCKQISRLYLCLPKRVSNYRFRLLEAASLDCLSELCLEHCALEPFLPNHPWRLQWLDLRFCSGTEAFIERLLSGNQLQFVKVFRLSGRLSRQTFLSLLFCLNENRHLEELSFRLDGLLQLAEGDHNGRSLAPLKLEVSFDGLRTRILGHLKTHGSRLRSVIVDIRQDIDFCEPCLSFSIQDMASIMNSCPSLTFLSLPVHFHNLSSDQVRHLHHPVKLQALHMRGDSGSFSDLGGKIRTLVSLFKSPPSFQIFVGHGKRLKVIHIPPSGRSFFTSVSRSQRLSYCLDL